MPQHRPAVLLGNRSINGSCSCGWVGPDRDTATDARKDANQHAIDGRKSEQLHMDVGQKPPKK